MRFTPNLSMRDGAAALTRKLGVGNPTVFRLILLSAVLLVGARVIAPFEVGKDQASQLEAAQRLTSGLGLTTTNDVPPSSLDIAEAPNAEYLTWWPPGFSLIVAGFLFAGVPLLVALKIIYAVVTLIGWAGWGVLASRFLSRPLEWRGKSFRAHFVVAALLPAFTTLWWGGTDIFLWGGIPWIFLILFNSGAPDSPYLPVSLAGLIFGSLYAVRYASLFVGLAAFLILFQINFPHAKSFLKKFAVFAASSLLVIVPTVAYTKLYSGSGSALPDYANEITDSSAVMGLANEVLLSLPMLSNLVFGYPLLEQAVYKLNWNPLTYASGAACLLAVVGLPLVLLTSRKEGLRTFRDDFALSFSFLPLSLAFFLIAILLLTGADLIGVRRYYVPVSLCGVFIAYEIASARVVLRAVKRAAAAVALLFLVFLCGYLPALALVPGRSGHVVYFVLGFTPPRDARQPSTSLSLRYPSADLYSRKESSRRKIQDLSAANPDALFFVEEYASFIYDGPRGRGPAPGRELRVLPRVEFWRRAHTSRAVKIFWVLEAGTKVDFVSASNQRVVYSDPFERTEIIESEFPAGHSFSGNHLTASRQK